MICVTRPWGSGLQRGANTLEITRRAGHSSSAFVLDRYGHLLDNARRETTERLSKMVRGAATPSPKNYKGRQ